MTTRKQAMQWWNGFEASTRESLCARHYTKRNFYTLTGNEIESMWKQEFSPEKETQTENIYLNRLKEQYKKYKQEDESKYFKTLANRYKHQYDAIRLFCLDTQLVSFNDIELMEFEINQSF